MWKRHLIKPESKFRLSSIGTGVPKEFDLSKDRAEDALKTLNTELEHLQELLAAEAKHKVLIVLQAMDTGGKDGTIRSVFSGVNPQGVNVVRFQAPSAEELAHDYLWRIHRNTPEKGQITIFNRSHYEDVVTVRVQDLVPAAAAKKRYGHINDFERMLTDEGVTVLKFFLHISKDEQKQRLQERLDDPKKHWKFKLGDLDVRKRWPQYMLSYQEAIERTSTPWAPWCVIPADKKWYRNLVVTQCIVDHLKSLKMSYPKLDIDPKKINFK